MSNLEEEIYSTMFTSLKHSIRRKILRMLSKRSRNFSEMLKDLGISSSHLTYHLENLGELVSKTDDGKYRLSKFGEAAVGTMSEVEEVRNKERFWSLPIKWKSFFVLLTIGLVVLAGVSYNQNWSLNRLSTEHRQLSTEFEQLSLENQQLSAENQRVNESNLFLESKYNETLKDFNSLRVLHEKILEDFNCLGQLHNDTLEDLSYVWQSYNETMNDLDYLQLLHNETLEDFEHRSYFQDSYLQKTYEWGLQYQETLQKLFDYLEFNAKFTGDVSGTGRVWCKAPRYSTSYPERALTISCMRPNFSYADFELTFNSTFGALAGTHCGYLHMQVSSIVDSTVEIFYTYGPENGLYYHLRGLGTFEVSTGPELLRIDTAGKKFTLTKFRYMMGPSILWTYMFRNRLGTLSPLWTFFPSFIVEVNISGT